MTRRARTSSGRPAIIGVSTAPGATAIEVLSGAKSISGERKSLWTEYAEAYNAAARQGSYYVRALGPNEAVLGEKLVEVRAGERAEVTFP